MKITAKCNFATSSFSACTGDQIDCDDNIAEDLVNAGYAEKEVAAKSETKRNNAGTSKNAAKAG